MMRDPESPDSGKCSNYSDESDVETSLGKEFTTPKKSSQKPVSRTLNLSIVSSLAEGVSVNYRHADNQINVYRADQTL